jgi:hypothetical protein
LVYNNICNNWISFLIKSLLSAYNIINNESEVMGLGKKLKNRFKD